MQQQEVTSSVIEIINKSLLEPKEVALSHKLIDDLDLDSIGFVEMSTALEKRYMIDISDEVIENCSDVQAVVEAVMSAEKYSEAEAELL